MWCARWIERPLRRLRGEGARLPPIIAAARTRGNELIDKLRDAIPARAAPKPKPEPKAKRTKRQIEPIHESFEAALEAGQACTMCLPSQAGTKGCREFMGPYFEQLRQMGFD